jgi:hypothetical protein
VMQNIDNRFRCMQDDVILVTCTNSSWGIHFIMFDP